MAMPERKSKHNILYAYDIEGQALTVRTAQEEGKLIQYPLYSNYFGATEKHNEAGCGWYVFPTGMVLYAGDCDEKLMQTFIHNRKLNRQQLRVIESFTNRPDVFWGKNGVLVATVLLNDGRVLYRSPGFDLQAYQEKLTKQT